MLQKVPAKVIKQAVDRVLGQPTPDSSAEAFRTWTDTTGKFSVEAKLVKAEGERAHLERKDGSVIQVPIKKLSEEDQQFLQSHSNP